MLDVGFGAALLAGLLSFVSPCVLPLVPPYLAYLAGLSFDQVRDKGAEPAVARRIVLASLAFVLGFTTVFVRWARRRASSDRRSPNGSTSCRSSAGAIIIVMGLHFLGVFRLALLYREARVNVAAKPAGPLGAYVMGLAFAFGWTPCVGPVLAAILFVAGSQGTALRGAALLATYSLGIGLPFLLAAAFATRFLDWAARFRRHMATVERVMGGALVLTGVLFVTGQMATISTWLLETFPGFSKIG